MESETIDDRGQGTDEWDGCDKLADLRCEYPHCTCHAMNGRSEEPDEPREIKFRGKRYKNGEWAYGSYVTNNYMRDWIYKETFPPVKVEVDPKTVGEYTGLDDKNGQDIFEGDIIEWLGHKWKVHVDTNHGTRFMYGSDQITKSVADNCEVIGNIYENPELITNNQ